MKIIDKVTVSLNERRDVYEALLKSRRERRRGQQHHRSSNTKTPGRRYLVHYYVAILPRRRPEGLPFLLNDLKPVQMPNMDLEELFRGRRAFTEAQWIDVLLRSTGLEPTH